MPRLYGAPSYTRPPHRVEPERPFDPDDLPLESCRSLAHLAPVEPATMTIDDGDQEAEETSFLRRAVLPFGLRPDRPSGGF